MTNYEQILAAVDEGVLTITLNRPDRLNAWTDTMQREVEAAIRIASADDCVRCIVVTGAGRGFCAGADMAGLQEIGAAGDDARAKSDFVMPEGNLDADILRLFPGRFGYIYACPKPIIAAINGPCAGIGLVFALYADLRFAAEDAKFTTAFAQRGLIAEHGISWVLPRLVGEANALDMLLTARKFLGKEAAEMGLVNKAMPVSDLTKHVGKLAMHLSQQVSPRSTAIMKRQIRAAYFQGFGAALEIANDEMLASFKTFDFKEGVDSFVERRAPAFQGR